jgi:predicted secreted hydrolase
MTILKKKTVSACFASVLSVLLFAVAMKCLCEPLFEDALPGLVLSFPKDHGKHPQFQTEWWYFTGNLRSEKSRAWGFQLTFFRRGLVREPQAGKSTWKVRDVYPAHFALTDVQNRKFFHAELLSREGPGLADAASERLSVRVKDWSAEQTGDEIRIKARQDNHAIDLSLLPLKPVVLHGRSGFSQKGENERQASYYYSFTRLKAEGTVTFSGVTHNVSGLAWMDHEFGSSVLSEDQAGWDWFSLQFDDNTELMVFRLRKNDGAFEEPVGTLVERNGRGVFLKGREIRVSSVGTWTSPHTNAVYPARWTIEIPDRGINLKISPLVEDQELHSGRSTGIVYWEGVVSAEGTMGGKTVQGRGYVELTGYAHSMAGRL